MKLLRFFVLHSLRDLGRNRGRTVFALLCVATGVAAVVALRSLAFMVGDELTSDLAAMNRGDLRLYASRGVPELVEFSPEGQPVFNHEAVEQIHDWADEEGVEVTVGRMTHVLTVRQIVGGEVQTPKTALLLSVEPDQYPFYGTILLDDPPGAPLTEVLPPATEIEAMARRVLPQLGAVAAMAASPGGPVEALALPTVDLAAHPRPIVISSNLTRRSGMSLKMGDILRIGASDTLFVVAGIAPAESETVLSTPGTVLLDFIYLRIEDLAAVGDPALPDQIFIKVPRGRDLDAVEDDLIAFLQQRFGTETDFDAELNRVTVAELAKQNEETASVIDDMILVMGLSSLLIGGIGIINTMLVIVSRRTVEIAVLKTLGLKGTRVTGLFLVEALLMGLIGGVIGVIAGVALSYAIRGVGEEAFGIGLSWRLYPGAMTSGLFLGIIVTGLFGFLPTLIAGQVRPAIVLRPNEAQMPAAGLLQVLVTLIVMILILGALVNSVVGGALAASPVLMLLSVGALVGLFVGLIAGNAGLGQPIPAGYRFRLADRYDRFDNAITDMAGRLTRVLPIAAWHDLPVRERGREAITLALRAFRQVVMLYGMLAVGAALASGIMLLVSEIWQPSGLGTAQPASHAIEAIRYGSVRWLVVWTALTLGLGLLIRWQSRAMFSLIAMAAVGATVGGALGWGAGQIGKTVLDGTALWDQIRAASIGPVLVEGALALMAVVFVGYWLLVWAVGKLPPGGLLAVVSLVVLLLAVALASVLAGLGAWAVGGAAVLAVAAAWGLYRWAGRRRPADAIGDAGEIAGPPAQSPGALRLPRETSVALAGVVVLVASFAVPGTDDPVWRWGRALASVAVFAGLWLFLRRRHRVDGRLVLREMVGRRIRAASTLLGLSVGIAGLSMVSLTTGAVSHLLEVQLGQRAEGNLLIVAQISQQRDAIRTALEQAQGVEHFTQFAAYRATLLEVNGEPVYEPPDDVAERQSESIENNLNFETPGEGIPTLLSERADLSQLPEYQLESGRQLRPEDAGTHRIMVRQSFALEHLGIDTGDHLLFHFANGAGEDDDMLIQFTVVGVIARQSEQTTFGDEFSIPPDTLPETIKPANVITIAQVDESDPAYMDDVLIALSDIPGVFSLELGALTQLLEDLLDQLKAIPTLVAWLAVVAGTAIIANTVALATQERRRQIGVMKAVGLKGRRVLGMLIVENGLIGLIAGLIGVAVGLLLTVVVVLASQSPDELRQALDWGTMARLILLSIGVAIGAATLSAWSAAAEKPMNVLRYE